MAYFLKKMNRKNGLYLAIYESFYSSDSKDTRHRCYQALGTVDYLKNKGIDDPIAFYSNEVRLLNLKRKEDKANNKFNQKLISEVSPEKLLGYFPLSRVLNNLDIKTSFDYIQKGRVFRFSLYDVFTSLVYARAVAPSSKHKTFHDVLPSLYKETQCSYDQILECTEFLGSEYERFVEILTVATKDNYSLNTSRTYFDCTNFYFEIDRESFIQRKGPSKENRKDPIVGMGLLLDANMIPIGMKIYPGNESEKPVLRNVIESLKNQNNIEGKTIQIADKGLNCARNIIEAVNHNDGYIFSKSVKTLPEEERKWVLSQDDYKYYVDENKNIKYGLKSCVDEFVYKYKDENGREFIKKIKEKRICIYNPKLARKKLQEIERLVEKAHKLSHSQAKRSEYGESSRYVDFIDSKGNKAESKINEDKINKDRELAGYNMLVTSETHMNDDEVYKAYLNLWRIEESFRVMKSELDARPVYLQKENSIKGHFLICYTAVLLLRLLQIHELKNKYSTSEICRFIKEFKVVQINENRYINLTRLSPFIRELSVIMNLPLTNFYFTQKQINMMHTR